MEIETLSDDGKKALIDSLNRSIQVEYGLILNYPRVIDYLIHCEKINDEILNKGIEKVGIDSSRHLGWVVEIINKIGGEPLWQIDTIDRLIDAPKMLNRQLEKEETVLEMYQEAVRLVRRYAVKAKVSDIFGKFIRTNKHGLQEEVIATNELVERLERIAVDERNHVKLLHDSIATMDYLMNK